MIQVITAIGLINRDALTVKDVITEEGNTRVIATEWYLGEQLVRRDVNVNVLAGIPLSGEQGGM
jgi:hypothetical protein